MTVAIIGAGPSGLALAKQLQDRNIAFTIFERDSGLGGVWNIANQHSVMYDSAHTISSKTMTEFSEFPMPEAFADYISHQKMLEYLTAFAEKFSLLTQIRFNTPVEQIKKSSQGGYEVKIQNKQHQYSHVVLAIGHVSKPNMPSINMENFSGEVLHSAQYKNPLLFKNKNVLVLGAGNSACDIACEATLFANNVAMSIRRGYHFIPKFILGMPADVFGETSVKLRLPVRLRQWINQVMLRIFQGNIQKIGFPKPDHRIFESHPIVNELLIYYVRQGDICIQKSIREVRASSVVFSDGRAMDVDIIVFATGYVPDFSCLSDELIPKAENLFLNLYSKQHPGLIFMGLVDPNGGVLGIIESQAVAIAQSIALNMPENEWLSFIQKEIPLNGGIQYIDSVRHRYEVDHGSYRRLIKKHIAELYCYSCG